MVWPPNLDDHARMHAHTHRQLSLLFRQQNVSLVLQTSNPFGVSLVQPCFLRHVSIVICPQPRILRNVSIATHTQECVHSHLFLANNPKLHIVSLAMYPQCCILKHMFSTTFPQTWILFLWPKHNHECQTHHIFTFARLGQHVDGELGACPIAFQDPLKAITFLA